MNWHKISGISGSLFMGVTFLANLQYSFGPEAAVFPPEVKKWVTMISAGATIILLTWSHATSQASPPSTTQPQSPILTKP
jgi:hypothetical protein